VITASDERAAGRVTDGAGFTSLIVALDLDATGDRALPVAHALAKCGALPVHLLTVSSPNITEDVDAYELRRRAADYGWPPDRYTVVHARRRPQALLVMATSAKRPISGHVLGSVTEEVLRTLDQPVLLVGPHVPGDYTITQPTLIACVDRADVAESAVPVVAGWLQTFGGAEPWVTQVVGAGWTASGPDDNSSANVRHVAKRLADEGIAASWGVLHGRPPEVRLERFGDYLTDPVFLATSVRWTDGRLHWRSATRQLVQLSTRPVLVVPSTAR
jgi:nucleotide-binding universal stress UspA family protein